MLDTCRRADSWVHLERVIPISTAQDNLAEALHPLLFPLYERYAFFELPEQLVASESVSSAYHRMMFGCATKRCGG
jgi:hypothetical protein